MLSELFYTDFRVSVPRNPCTDIVVGHDFFYLHECLEMKFNGNQTPLKVCNSAVTSVPSADLFTNLSSDCKPIAVKSRHFNHSQSKFIHQEVQKLLKDNVIEPSKSHWRAQVLVAGGGYSKMRLIVDYSQTVNRYTYLDVDPLPNMHNMIEQIAKYMFTCLDLKSAYHQVPIKPHECPYTAFEADGNLY